MRFYDVSDIRDLVYDFVLNFGRMSDVKKGKDNINDREVYIPCQFQ